MTGGGDKRISVRLSYMGYLRQRMGCKEEALALPAPVTVRSVLEELIGLHGDGVSDIFYNQYGWLDPRLFFLIDGEAVQSRGALDVEISGSEEITLVLGLPMSGG